MRDVAYAQIPRAARAEKHRLAADWIESLAATARRTSPSCSRTTTPRRSSSPGRRARRPPPSRSAPAWHSATPAIGRSRSAPFPAALKFLTQAIDLWPEDDPAWPTLALRHAQADLSIRQGGEQPLVTRALDRLLAAGDVDHGAEAEVLLAECDWFAGRSDSTFARLEHARQLVADRPASAAKTSVYAETSRFLMLANRNREAAEVGRESLALARELGLRELQANALNNIGTARVSEGDVEGFADLEQAFAIAEAINSPEALRALGNQASHMGQRGELRRARELYEHVVELSRRLGISGFVRWCEVELALLDYHAGRWNVALESAEAFLATIDEAHYMEPMARQVPGRDHGRTRRHGARAGRVGACAGVHAAPRTLRFSTPPWPSTRVYWHSPAAHPGPASWPTSSSPSWRIESSTRTSGRST